jgi:hypothetical protein
MRMIAVSVAVNVVLTRVIEAVNVVSKTRRLQARPVSIAVRYNYASYTRRHYVWRIYRSRTCRTAPRSSWI